jgi:PleD family two-component response regulator
MNTGLAPIPHGHDAANILLVDDQPARLLTYRAILEPLGHNLVAVNSGLEALEALMKQDFAGGAARREDARAWTASRPRR